MAKLLTKNKPNDIGLGPDFAERSRRLPNRLESAIKSHLAIDADVLILGCDELNSIAGLLGEIAPRAKITIATDDAELALPANVAVIRLDLIDQTLGETTKATWDLIVDGGCLPSICRIDSLLKLAPCLRLGGLYILIDPAKQDTPHDDASRSVLDALCLLGGIINSLGLRANGMQIAIGAKTDRTPTWPAGKLRGYARALIDRIEIRDSEALLYRSRSNVAPLLLDDRLTSADLPWPLPPIHTAEYSIEIPKNAGDDRSGLAVMIAEMQRLDSAVTRRDLDIIALENERQRLLITLDRVIALDRDASALDCERHRLEYECQNLRHQLESSRVLRLARFVRRAPRAAGAWFARLSLAPFRLLRNGPENHESSRADT